MRNWDIRGLDNVTVVFIALFISITLPLASHADKTLPTVRKSIGPAGGQIELKGDMSSVKMVIPSGALSTDTEITIRQVATPPPDKFFQQGIPVGNTFSFEPHGLRFLKVVSIIFTYNDKILPKGADEASILVYVDEPDGLFHAEGGAVCDPEKEPGPDCIDTESIAQGIDVNKNLATVFVNKLSRRLPYYQGTINELNSGANAAESTRLKKGGSRP